MNGWHLDFDVRSLANIRGSFVWRIAAFNTKTIIFLGVRHFWTNSYAVSPGKRKGSQSRSRLQTVRAVQHRGVPGSMEDEPFWREFSHQSWKWRNYPWEQLVLASFFLADFLMNQVQWFAVGKSDFSVSLFVPVLSWAKIVSAMFGAAHVIPIWYHHFLFHASSFAKTAQYVLVIYTTKH